jgi:hypothetical protein
MTTPLNPQTLPDNDNIPGNHYAYCVRLDGQLFMQSGRMIAYYPAASMAAPPQGNRQGIRFEPLSSASIGGFVAAPSPRRSTPATGWWPPAPGT